jgi:membrane dipeptidase
LLRFLVLLAFVFAACGESQNITDEQVMRVHRSALLIDTHNDVTSETVKGLDIGGAAKKTHTDIPRLKAGGVGTVFFAAYVASSYAKEGRAAHRALEMIDTVRHDIVNRHRDQFQLATTADAIVSARKTGKIAALIGIEGGHAIEDNLRLLRSFYALGVRYMTLTHSNTNNWADSSGDMGRKDVKRHRGLTDFGREVVREMNRIGMIVDVSHVADETFWDVLETSTAPVFASHSSCRSIASIPRNMTDEMIVAMAKKGGVIQINFGCQFLRPARSGRATLADVVKHIDHVVTIAGIDAVGIGSDYDGVNCVPDGLEDVSKFPGLTRALLEKGYSEDAIRKIYGGNTLRVMRAVEKISQAGAPAR